MYAIIITAGMWAGLIITFELQCMLNNQKRTETGLIKRFLKRNLADVGMAQRMHWLTMYICTQTRSAMHTVICTPYHGHIIQQPSLHK